jgi:hypothetical protein
MTITYYSHTTWLDHGEIIYSPILFAVCPDVGQPVTSVSVGAYRLPLPPSVLLYIAYYYRTSNLNAFVNSRFSQMRWVCSRRRKLVREVDLQLPISLDRLRFQVAGWYRWTDTQLGIIIDVFVQSIAGWFLNCSCKNESCELQYDCVGWVGIIN